MSALDQAFIKVFAKDAPGPTSQPKASSQLKQPAQAANPASRQPAAQRVAARASDPPSGPAEQGWYRVEGPQAAAGDGRSPVPAPHMPRSAASEPSATLGQVGSLGQSGTVEPLATVDPLASVSQSAAMDEAAGDPATTHYSETTGLPSSWQLPPMLVMPALLELPASLAVLEPGPSEAAPAEEKATPQASPPPAAAGPPAESDSAAEAARQEAAGEQHFAPVWEVDRFQWSSVCEQLCRSEAGYFTLAGQKLLAAIQAGLKVLAVTSSRRGEGRTTLALCLARFAAAAGNRVAVLDADFQSPQLAQRVGLQLAFGWQDMLTANQPLAEVAVTSLADQLTLLPLAASDLQQSLSLQDPRVAEVIREAASHFDLLLIDMGPLDADQPLWADAHAQPIEAALVVRDLRHTSAEETYGTAARLQEAGVEGVAIAENFE